LRLKGIYIVRIINGDIITKTVADLCVEANIVLGTDIRAALQCARENEGDELPSFVLDTLIENADIAERERLPICQDTGMAVVFVDIGTDIHISGDICGAINNGVRMGYRAGYCRNSVVADPIRRVNTGDNTPAVIHYDFIPGDRLHITVAPKGFGSENMSALKMFSPSDGLPAAEDFIVETVKRAGPNPCPPIIVGVGMGGTFERAALLAKRALLRDAGEANSDGFWGEFEARLLSRINELNIGPAGFGGRTTALGVHILTYPTHIAGLPVAVNIGCHATRHRTAVL
jgi:fumarate hydratase subunit alpha